MTVTAAEAVTAAAAAMEAEAATAAPVAMEPEPVAAVAASSARPSTSSAARSSTTRSSPGRAGSGRWDVTVSNPVADPDSAPCGDAPDDESFSFAVTRQEDAYAAQDDLDAGAAWTVQIRDKSGACSATFKGDAGGGATWALIPGEDGPGGPLGGTARFELRAP